MASPSESEAVWFPNWSEALERVRLPLLHREHYRQALKAGSETRHFRCGGFVGVPLVGGEEVF